MTLRCPRALFAFSFAALLCAPTSAQQADPSASNQTESLGDIARHLRKDTTNEVRMTESDTKKLFELVDKIFAFAAEDTGMPKRAVVKRRMVSKDDVEKFASGRLAKEEYTQRFAQAELSMKKLGFLPREFNLREFLVKSTGANVAGYYDDETKTISLLNWVPVDRQEPILAHELTHALQDQNYDLRKWMKAADGAGKDHNSDNSNDDGATARKAVVEGQAMVVYVDYMLAPLGRNLADTPDLIYQMEQPAVKAVADSQMLHDAPMILREVGTLAYDQGLIFEGELLHRGGKKMAFAGVFSRPPHNSHEVLQPETYITQERLPGVHIPDVHQILNHEYALYDSGGIGELEVRALLKQYGERRVADELSSAWQGGAYATYRRTKGGSSAEIAPGISDLGLLYVSRWKSPQAAERFAHFYAGAVSQRYRGVTPQAPPTCSGVCPVSVAAVSTAEGPVIVEHWPDNSVVVSEGFDVTTAAKLSGAVREVSSTHAYDQGPDEQELGLRLGEIPAFQDFQSLIGKHVFEDMAIRSMR